ncbi:hypothetical protein B0H10DRAFT_2212285 [Mycena sp. CBHHK59/15]|nr:hypothetical protein B0H10DRAFT_2212285 [Mycena sp. CBHHK59/15]
MLPAADLNFVVCGLATFAATVGYAFVRKFRPLPLRRTQTLDQPGPHLRPEFSAEAQSGEVVYEEPIDESMSIANGDNAHDTPAQENQAVSQENPLKRKRVHEHEDYDLDALGYPHNLKAIYPNKRRSGSVSDQDSNETETIEEPPEISDSTNIQSTDEAQKVAQKVVDVGAECRRGRHSTDPRLETPKAAPALTDTPRFPKFQTPQRRSYFPTTRSSASPGFANFAGSGSSSPFGSFGPSKEPVLGRPVWASSDADAAQTTLEATVDANTEATAPALAAAKNTVPLSTPQTPLTGEEEEEVCLELKAVKLYIKRDEDSFSGAMLGHIKLLSHNTTHSKRLLFRREPLWKVSMNVRMQTTVRCTFDSQEDILRVALKELGEKQDFSEAQTVIYAFKPGRGCRKSDFRAFSESLLAHARQDDQT